MKKIFIKDERLRQIHSDLCDKTTKMFLNGKLKGSYTIKESTKEFKDGIYFGWEITDYEDDWKIDELDNFEITIKKSGKYYCAECRQFFTECAVASLMACGETVEGALERFLKKLKAEKKTLCMRGHAIECEVEQAIYE